MIALAVTGALSAPLIQSVAMNSDSRFMHPKLKVLNKEKESWKGSGKRKMRAEK